MKIQGFDELFTSNIKQIKTNNIEFIVLTNFSLKNLFNTRCKSTAYLKINATKLC